MLTYEAPEMVIISFEAEDVIVTSTPGEIGGADEGFD